MICENVTSNHNVRWVEMDDMIEYTFDEILPFRKPLSLQLLDLSLRFSFEEENAEFLDQWIQCTGEVCSSQRDRDDGDDEGNDEGGVDHLDNNCTLVLLGNPSSSQYRRALQVSENREEKY